MTWKIFIAESQIFGSLHMWVLKVILAHLIELQKGFELSLANIIALQLSIQMSLPIALDIQHQILADFQCKRLKKIFSL